MLEAEGANWVEKWLNLLERLESITPRERFEDVAPLLLRQQYGSGEDGDLLHLRAQKVLLETPGHAAFFRDIIRQRHEARDDNEDLHEKEIRLRWMFAAFQVLENLPSVETVAVLEEFIRGGEEDQEPSGEDEQVKMMRMELSPANQAMRTLDALIADDRPFSHLLEETDWKVWCEEVKAGTRTFRFEGDPQEYNLDGPVREARHGPATNRTARRDAADGTLAGEPSTGFTPFRMILTGMAVLLCLWASWRCWKMRPGSVA